MDLAPSFQGKWRVVYRLRVNGVPVRVGHHHQSNLGGSVWVFSPGANIWSEWMKWGASPKMWKFPPKPSNSSKVTLFRS